jgi:hypothetical protein
MPNWFWPTLAHTIEAVVVFAIALGVAHFFPGHADEAGLAAVGALAFILKALRASDVPVPDYTDTK